MFFYTARAWKDAFQLEAFSEAVGTFSHNAQQRFLDWPAALRALTSLPCDSRLVIVIDEFQYIAKERPSVLSELQVLWMKNSLAKTFFSSFAAAQCPLLQRKSWERRIRCMDGLERS